MKQILLLKRFRILFTLIFLFTFIFIGYTQQLKRTHDKNFNKGHQLYKQAKIYDNTTKSGSETRPRAVGDRAQDRMEYEFRKLKNPYTNKIPRDIIQLELEFSKNLPIDNATPKLAKNGGYGWTNRGPYNVGGRTRALAISRGKENVIFAGGVSGGIWRSQDSGETWRKLTKRKQSPNITCIVQDPRKGYGNIWYYGSGERSGNSASGGGAFYTGTGIYKSKNGGKDWNLLESTADNTVATITPFDIVNSIAVDPKNGDVYVATFNGVHRSKDGGETFEEVLAGGFDNWTEVMITPSGKIYATVHFFGTDNFGLYVTDDGNTWTRLSDNAPTIFNGRTVMTYDPSNENIVYFFAESLVGAPYLLRYNATADPVDQWADLSANLPNSIGGQVGDLNLQGRYNMFIRVKPDDPSFIVLGGTNLYRSTTGFTTPAGQESWIGGYSPINNISVYPDQHPDQHNLIFFPSNPNKVLSATDGGLHITEDITATVSQFEPVDWTSLNNGYLTTQPYAVSFDPEPNSNDLLAGFQDNGTWFTDSDDRKTPWIEDFGGDGSYNAIADGGRTRYVSSQFSNIYRLNFDDAGNFISFARIRPAIATNPDFINPFVLDPNNDNIMYLPDGNRMLRNNNLDEVPGGTFAFATANWVVLPQTTTPDNSIITALDVSSYPEANKLYYGTNSGGIYRMDNANIDDQEVVDLSTSKGLPPGYVSSITVDPSNSDRVLVVFSNYGIPSVFLTNDAGLTWEDVSGNLEKNPDGSGNGPSVRWASFFGNKHKFYVGTSVGLFFADKLRGNKTKWYRENIPFGNNAVVAQVKSRKDGFIAMATHGNGLYSGKFRIPDGKEIPQSTLSVAYLLNDFVVDLNSADTEIDVTGLFISSNDGEIEISLSNSNPDLVTATLEGNTLKLSYAPGSEGGAAIGLTATNGVETVSEGFTVTVVEPAIYEQVEAAVGSQPAQFFTDFGGLVQSADDFTVPIGNTWSINSVLAFGGINGSPILDNATVVIYEDDGGKPGAEVFNSGVVVPDSEADDANLNIPLATPAELNEGSYWLAVYTSVAFDGGNQWFWTTQGLVNGTESHLKDDLNLFGSGAIDWTPTSLAFGNAPADLTFQLFGVASDTSSSTNQTEANLATLDGQLVSMAYPNPSSNIFNFNIQSLGKGKASMRIHSLNGRLVYRKDSFETSKQITWDASNVSSGMYLVVIQGDDFKYSGKLIKQ